MTNHSDTAPTPRPIVLLGGLWLPATVWDEVGSALTGLGDQPIPVTLPGQGDDASGATLQDQLEAALAAVDGAARGPAGNTAENGGAERPYVVGHSAACTLAWMVADRRPDAIGGVALIGGFPSAAGATYAEFFEIQDGVMPFPGWEPFAGDDSADLSDDARSALAATAIPVPEGVARGTVTLDDKRRFEVPVTLICPEFTPSDAQDWITAGDVPELAAAHRVDFVDIDSGHWPMITRPAELAAILHRAAGESRS